MTRDGSGTRFLMLQRGRSGGRRGFTRSASLAGDRGIVSLQMRRSWCFPVRAIRQCSSNSDGFQKTGYKGTSMTVHSDDEIYSKLALFVKELQEIVRENGIAAVGHSAKEAAPAQRRMIAVIVDKSKQQERHIAWMLGEKIEPEQ